ncbi:MAG TPA: wax ester/triacylglycerol synthase family O-acyltransferase [Candidatus Bathyarchaeia archaeon]|nr:wax ester/triacylglycerol synthase family O-acyltransferase [Candidatus Bathyarchaeia archaeon]
MARYAYDRLTALDNSFLVMEGPTTHMHVGSAMILDGAPLARSDGGIDADLVRQYVLSRLHLIPRYRQRLAKVPFEGHPVWVDDEHFNIHYHVRHTALPRPGDERQLKRLCARIVSQPLDRAKPLWEIWIVEGLAGGDRFALVSKTHHCMIDGISGVDLIEVLMRPTPEDDFEKPETWLPRPSPSGTALFLNEVLHRVTAPLAAIPQALRSPGTTLAYLRDGATALGEMLATQMHMTSETPLNRTIGPHRRFDWLVMDVAALKRVKNHLGGSVNDVVLATVAGALRRWLSGRRVNADLLQIRAMVPVSVRTSEERGALGNRVAAWMVDLPVDERDPRRRLERVAETTGKLKHSKQALGAEMLTQVSEWSGSTLLSLGVQLVGRARPFNLVVTNVPGPQVPLYLLGAEMRECYPLVPLFVDQGLGIALFSYSGKLFWGFNADWDIVPDLHDFVVAIDLAFKELLRLTQDEPAVIPIRPEEGHGRPVGAESGRAAANPS